MLSQNYQPFIETAAPEDSQFFKDFPTRKLRLRDAFDYEILHAEIEGLIGPSSNGYHAIVKKVSLNVHEIYVGVCKCGPSSSKIFKDDELKAILRPRRRRPKR
jgi:hypothetical protein